MNWMKNYIWLTWKLACMLKTYKTCNPMVRFLKYEFNNKLLGSVTLLRSVISSVTWTQHIYIYIDHFEILQIWRIYKDNVIQWLICQNSHSIKKYLVV